MKIQTDEGCTSGSSAELVDPPVENDPFDYQSIVVPIDFSEHSSKTIQYATRLASSSSATVILLHVCRAPQLVAANSHSARLQTNELRCTQREADEKLATVQNELLQKGVVAMALVRTGCPLEEIATVARQMNVDLIVIGSHGNTGIKHLALGSTAEKVVQYASCPVLVVKGSFTIPDLLPQ